MACFALRLTAQDSVDILQADKYLWCAIFDEYKSSVLSRDGQIMIFLFDQKSASDLQKAILTGVPDISCKQVLLMFALKFTERYKKVLVQKLMLATLKS